MREIVVGAAQMGPIQKADSREMVVARMVDLLEQAKKAGCHLVVYPELCLTTFFPPLVHGGSGRCGRLVRA